MKGQILLFGSQPNRHPQNRRTKSARREVPRVDFEALRASASVRRAPKASLHRSPSPQIPRMGLGVDGGGRGGGGSPNKRLSYLGMNLNYRDPLVGDLCPREFPMKILSHWAPSPSASPPVCGYLRWGIESGIQAFLPSIHRRGHTAM